MDSKKGFYLDLEQELHVLILHYGMCHGAMDPEVIDWARFFQRWAEEASKRCGPWSREALAQAREIYRELEKSKLGKTGYEDLGRAMAFASRNLNIEIKSSLLSEMWK
jgi:hypothetical protein